MSLNANRFRLEQLLRCLLDNAFLHGEGHIELSARPDHTGLQLVILIGAWIPG